MDKKVVENQLKNAVECSIPDDMRSKIIDRCKKESDGTPMVVHSINYATKRRERFLGLVAAVALLFLMCNVLFKIYDESVRNRVDYVVDIDVNPSIELQINAKDRVVMVRAINSDAIAILDGMELKGTQTKVAVNAIIGSMFEHGYLKGETNKLLVSVDGKTEEKSEQVQQTLTKDINKILESYSPESSAIGQIIVKDADVASIVATYGISDGKAVLIKKIIDIDGSYDVEELVKLNITELYTIIYDLQGISVVDGSIVEDDSIQEQIVVSCDNDMALDDNGMEENVNSGNTGSNSNVSVTNSGSGNSGHTGKPSQYTGTNSSVNTGSNKNNSKKDSDSKNKNQKKGKKDKNPTVSDNYLNDKDKNDKDKNDKSDKSNDLPDTSVSENSASENSASENSASENMAVENLKE